MPYLLVAIHVVLLEYTGRCSQVASLVIVGKVESLTKMVLVSFICLFLFALWIRPLDSIPGLYLCLTHGSCLFFRVHNLVSSSCYTSEHD